MDRMKLDEPFSAGPRQTPNPADPYDGRADSRADTPLVKWARVAYKRRYAGLMVCVLFMTVVLLQAFTATPLFEAKAQLMIEPQNANIVAFKEVVEQTGATNDYYQTQYRLLQSRTLAKKVITNLKLWNSPALHPPAGFSVTGFVRSGLSSVRGLFGSPAGAESTGETAAETRDINAFLAALNVTGIRNSRLVDVRFRSVDPKLAQSAANEIGKAYIDQALEYRFLASKEAADWLSIRLKEQRDLVEKSEAALQRYRESNDAISLEERQNIVVQKLGDLNAAVTRAKTERIQKEALYNQMRAVQNDRAAIDTIPVILANPYIQQLKADVAALERQQKQLAEKFAERHPEVVKVTMTLEATQNRLQGEIGKAVQAVRNEYQAAAAQENAMLSALEGQKREAFDLNRKSVDYGVLQREAASNRSIYESLLQRAKETDVSGELQTSNIRVVDNAELPRSPVTPRKGFSMVLALCGGLFLGLAAIVFLEHVDNRIKTPDEIRSHLGVPFLGLVPAVRLKTPGVTQPLITNAVPPGFIEAFRSIRTNVLFSSAHEGAKSIVVTSSGPREGKTSVACNLATSLATAGQRVLLIDADLRRPRVHQVFEVEAEPGLSNLMVGTSKASEVVRRTNIGGLWLLPAGRIPPNPAELLGSQRMRDFLGSLTGHFDWVIIDSPPIMAVTDAAVIGNQATAALFVVGSEMTSRQTASTALDHLESAHVPLIGAVLNRVDLEKNPHYYATYYRREYTDYYAKTS